MMLSRLIQKRYQPTYKAICWLMMQELIFAICGLVDITCANFVSDDAVISITMAVLISDFALNLRYVFGSSLRVTTARYYGADNKSAVGGVLTSITILSFVLTVIIVCVLGLFSGNLLKLFALTPSQTDLACEYIKARIPGFLIFGITNPMVRSLEAQGNVSKITKIRLVNLLNAPLSLILMQFWGVAGIGLASSITEAIELPVVYFAFKPYYSKPKMKEFKETLMLGLTYLPESLFGSAINTVSMNLCVRYLSVASAVALQLVEKFYTTFLDLVHASTRHVDIALGQAYGTGDNERTTTVFDNFKHCYIQIWIVHIIVVLITGAVYFNFIADVESPMLAMVLLAVWIIAEVPWIIAEPLMRTCFVFKDVKVIMITRIAGIALLQIPAQIIALKLGADVFCMPICYIATDFLWFVVTYRRYRKLPIYHKNEKYNSVPQISGV